MRTTTISSFVVWNTPRNNITRLQSELSRLSEEVVTGRMSDVGRELGAKSAQTAKLHIDIGAYSSAILNNDLTAKRLEQTQATLGQLATDANAFLEQLIAKRTTEGKFGASASLALSGFIDRANAFDGQSYLLAGINSGEAPLADYDGAPKTAVDAAFLTAFGMAPDSASVSGISAAAMGTFLDGAFATLFADPNWGTIWSSASDQAIRSRISPTETIDTSAGANDPAMRKLAMVYTMVAGLGIDGLADDTRQVVIDKTIELLGDAISGLTDLRADIGVRQSRVSDATERLEIQKSIVENRLGRLEGVDPAEAKVKIDTITTQIEMSYSLTTRLLRLSILNYA